MSTLDPALFDLDNHTRDDPQGYQDLLPSIREKGVLHPVLARPKEGGRFGVVAGRRRVQACLELGIDVPTLLRDWSDDQAIEVEITENLIRKNLSPVETARALITLLAIRLRDEEEFIRLQPRSNPTPEGKVASLMHRLRKAVSGQEQEDQARIDSPAANIIIGTFQEYGRGEWRHFADVGLAMLSYPDDVQAYINAGGGVRAARELAQIKDAELRQKAVDRAKELQDGKHKVGEMDAAKRAAREVLAGAKNQRQTTAYQQAAETASKSAAQHKTVDNRWHFPDETYEKDAQYGDLYHPLWGQGEAGPYSDADGEIVSGVVMVRGHVDGEFEVPLGIYGRLLASYTVPAERVVSIDSPISPLIEFGTGLGRLVCATNPEVTRPGIVAASPHVLPLQREEADLAVLHLPAWNEVDRAGALGWGPEAAAADSSQITDYDEFIQSVMLALDEAKRVEHSCSPRLTGY
nr:ParB/RepB/Spo0J family partition protein [Deinococcus psychrotolerans]